MAIIMTGSSPATSIILVRIHAFSCLQKWILFLCSNSIQKTFLKTVSI